MSSGREPKEGKYLSSHPHACPKCRNNMEEGFITGYGGIYWRKNEFSFSRTALKAYKCPKCGYVEIYQRYRRSS